VLLGDEPPEPPHAANASTPKVIALVASVGLTLAIAIFVTLVRPLRCGG
jgi:hypothetical protein